jgi:hypothetical protein
MSTEPLRVGDTCQLNQLGRSRSPKTTWEFAVVLSVLGRGKSYRILPLGRSEPIRMHGSYLEGTSEAGDAA